MKGLKFEIKIDDLDRDNYLLCRLLDFFGESELEVVEVLSEPYAKIKTEHGAKGGIYFSNTSSETCVTIRFISNQELVHDFPVFYLSNLKD